MSESLDDVKRRILTRVNLASLVGETVKLSSRSGKLAGCCPFHTEDSPSFYLYDDHYHCFGCKAHGDAITWVREREGLSFVETLRHLAKKYGIEAPELDESGGRLAKHRSDATLFQMMAEAQLFFVTMLESSDGDAARAYLINRGFTAAAIKDFGFGVTPKEPFGLARHLQKKGFRDVDLKAVGLTSSNTSGGRPYDFFRNRVMLPIQDAQGRVIAFGGRTLDGAQPKYLNTGATVLFEKSHTLFGFDRARKRMREKGRAIVVEGYMDTLMLWQQGFDEAVACLGTAFTEHHLKLLKNATNNVTLLFDGDSPGQAAALKTVEIALKAPDVYIKAAALSNDEDPDTFVQKNGAEALAALLAKAADLFDFAIHQKLNATHNLAIPELIAKEFVPWLAKLPDRMQRTLLANRIASKAGLKLEFIDRELMDHFRQQAPVRPSGQAYLHGAPAFGNVDRMPLDAAPLVGAGAAKPLDGLGRDLFANLYFAAPGELDTDALSALARRELELDDAHTQLLQDILQILAQGSTPAASTEPLMSAMEPAIAQLLERFQKDAAAYQYPEGATRAMRVEAVASALRAQRIKAQIKDLKNRLVRVERSPEGIEEERKILGMIRELQKTTGV